MELSEKLKKIDLEIQNGHLEKSIRRLKSLINVHPNNLNLRNKLAELYFKSGFIASAGKYWLLTEPSNKKMANSIEVYLKSVNHSPIKILKDLKFRGNIDKLPIHSISILKELYKKKEEINLKSKKLNPNYPKIKQHKHNSISFSKILIIFLLISIPILLFIGLITILKWVL